MLVTSSNAGYLHDAATGLYYDANTGFYYDSKAQARLCTLCPGLAPYWGCRFIVVGVSPCALQLPSALLPQALCSSALDCRTVDMSGKCFLLVRSLVVALTLQPLNLLKP